MDLCQFPIHHINFSVPNLTEAVQFYTQTLGFQIAGQYAKDDRTFFFLTDGAVTYEVIERSDLDATSIDHLAYASQDLVADHAAFQAKGAEVTPIGYADFLFDNGMSFFFVKAPNGQRFEFCQNGNVTPA